jgi:uncharacterized Tic20 family protein
VVSTQTGPQPPRDWTSSTDRQVGALAHLGIPIYGFILPLVIWAMCRTKPFRRDHARQAFAFQCAFLVPYASAVGLVMFGDLDPIVLAVMLGIGFLLELPQVVRALSGRRPLGLVPFQLLPE